MATYRVTNHSKAARGVYNSAGRLVWIQSGGNKVFDVADIAGVERLPFLEAEPVGDVPSLPASLKAKVDPLDHDGDGKKGGSAKGAQSTRTRGSTKRKAPQRAKATK